MRAVIWFVLLFAAAVVAATALGTNDGLVTFYWRAWRLDLSLNLFLLLLIGSCFVLVTVIQAIHVLTGLPQRAHEWRVSRRDRAAQAALRDALSQYFGGRYSRAQKAAERALAIQADTEELAADAEFSALGHLLHAGSAHRLQDRTQRDEHLGLALSLAGGGGAATRAAEEGARLLAAEWALDDRDAPRASELLAQLPPGVARRTQALRLKLQAARLGRQPMEALKTARMLAKHQGFSKVAALGLLRSLAFESLDATRDIDQLRQLWLQLDAADRRDPFVAARAATLAARFAAAEDGRSWLRPFWDRASELGPDERAAIADALIDNMAGLSADWLPRLEAVATAFPRESAVALAVGSALAQLQLWGKARRLLTASAHDETLPAASRRRAWMQLARIAADEGNDEDVRRCEKKAANL